MDLQAILFQFTAESGMIKDVIPDLVVEENEKCKKLTDKSTEAVSKYIDLRKSIIPDKSVKIDEIPSTLAKLMKLQNLTYDVFAEDLKEPTEESLKQIVDKLEVGYKIFPFQENPPIAVLKLGIDTPFVAMGIGNTYKEAVQETLLHTFRILNSFMKIKL